MVISVSLQKIIPHPSSLQNPRSHCLVFPHQPRPVKLCHSVTNEQRFPNRIAAETGNLGDVAKVGEGVFEMREHFGPGWRMYYIQHGELLVVMLGGGDKSTQRADIRQAIALAKTLEK